MPTPVDHRGATLPELLVALGAAGVVAAAAASLLLTGQRLATAQAVRLAVRRNVHAAATVLRAELHGVDPSAGDLVQAAGSSMVLRAQRAFGVVCAVDTARPAVVLDDSLFSTLRAPDPTRDSLLVYRDGVAESPSDDRWVAAAFEGERSVPCPGGRAGRGLDLAASTSRADLAGIAPGSPARVFETVEYRLYSDAGGGWWLGSRTAGAAGWTATTPIAGPLKPTLGLQFRCLGVGGAATADLSSVVAVDVAVRGRSAERVRWGAGTGWIEDSLRVVVATGRP